MKKGLMTVLLSALLCLCLFWMGSIIKCEVLTVRHGHEFLSFDEVQCAYKYKVLTYNNSFARVYCVNTGNGSVHNYVRQDGNWVHNEWEAGGWSTSGSADGYVWPYVFDTVKQLIH